MCTTKHARGASSSACALILCPGGTVWCEDGWHPRLVVRGLDAEGGEPTQRCACFESIGWSDVRKVRTAEFKCFACNCEMCI
eukprot:scaffold215445_cov44-Tisochrysis_lutea.AAC.1